VDGGIMNNLPGDIMRQRSCATVMVVDVGSVQSFTVSVPEFPSPWRFLWSRIAPLAAHIDIPTIAALLMRTTEVSSIQKTAEVKKDADVCLRPPLDRYGILQFESLDEIAEVGYRYAKEKLQRLGDDKSLVGLFPS
jgi:predicted acylesterase/phospholipase RssA